MAARRLALTLSALPFLWTCAATAYLLRAWSPGGLATAAILGTTSADASRPGPALMSANGVWMAALLLLLTVLAGTPMGIVLTQPRGHRAAAWGVGAVLLGFCLIAGRSVGLVYLPGSIFLLVAGLVAAERRA